MSADIEIPRDYSLTLAGGVDLGLEELKDMKLNAGLDNIKINNIPKITVDAGLSDIRLKEFPNNPLKTDSKVDMGLDDIRITQLPKIELEAQFSIKPTRVHLPMNYRLSIGVMGYELLGFAFCGEGMVITEDYHEHVTEKCA
jgi:hypothetical protein